jgi:hypothetical protein
MKRDLYVSLHRIRLAYSYFRGKPLPDDLPFDTAGNTLIQDFGYERVRIVLDAIGDVLTDDNALAAAKAADPGATAP